MPVKLHRFLPTYGASRLIVGGGHGTPAGVAHSDRDASIDYLASIVRAAESFGFIGALIPTGAWCEDAFVTAALLARETTSLAFLVAFRPGFVSPTLSAQMAATFARHAPGRILLNVVVGGEAHEQRAFGDHLDKDAQAVEMSRTPRLRRSMTTFCQNLAPSLSWNPAAQGVLAASRSTPMAPDRRPWCRPRRCP